MRVLLAKIWKALHLPKNIQLSIMRILQDQFLIGVTGIIFDKDKNVLLFNHTYRQRAWSLPGGYIKRKEHPGEGLEREIKEESGFVVSADKEFKLRTDRETARLDICYIGIFIGGNFKPSEEVKDYGFFPFDKLPLLSQDQLLLIKEAYDYIRKNKEIIKQKETVKSKGLFSFLRKLF